MSTLSVRIDENQEKTIRFLMKNLQIRDKSAFIRKLLDKSMKEELLNYLCSQIKEKKITIWKSAEIAGISLRAMMREANVRGVILYDDESFLEDLEFAFEK